MQSTWIRPALRNSFITTGTPPQLRIDGKLHPLKMPPLSPQETKQICYSVLTDAQKHRFEETNELDLSFSVQKLSRFRGNIFVQRGNVAGAFRAIPFKILTFEELNLPGVLRDLAKLRRGYVLVTGATGNGGLLVIKGNASSRCGISMKGIDIVVFGNIGHMSAFMAQSGNLVVLGDAGESLGDSLYEARLFVRGSVKSLGADCIEKEMRAEHIAILQELLERTGAPAKPEEFKRYGSARELYNFNIDNASAY